MSAEPVAPAPNAALLWRTLGHVEANMDLWDQNRWWCGTSGCYAGHAVVLAGAEVVEGWGLGPDSTWVRVAPGDPLAEQLEDVMDPERRVPLAEYARVLLGLSAAQSKRLFYGYNTLFDLRCLVQQYTDMQEAPV